MRQFIVPTAFVLTVAATPAAMGATLQVDGSGRMTGATGVSIGGDLFDVTFLDGTCAALFDGCGAAADFDFTTFAGAEAAATALLGQVFLDGAQGTFDSDPEFTRGCEATFACSALIPYGEPGSGVFASIGTFNYSAEDSRLDGAFGVAPQSSALNLTQRSTQTFALFSEAADTSPGPQPPEAAVIPLPAAGWLMLVGFAALADLRRRRR